MNVKGSPVLMESGLLWFDDSAKVTLATKVENAARRYRERFGKSPNVCYVHPQTLAGATVKTTLRIVELASMQPNYFWVGVQPGRRFPQT